ncbi:uncharacterized protein LOC121853568 [Homarus americanus]|uniref:Uncharacterized protein n=1 Tax=Homarus americanus TaxID=6706 RepID=A0A8J5JID4_HOMAM|nr:uncharacterized protein LOC121853568 [Homarus americanus]KAG7156731.1 hypothetical protein Hamer_G006727 [Homarus americanus]
MPRYRGVLQVDDASPDDPLIHLFDYSSTDEHNGTSKSSYRKQLVAVDSCIFLRRRNLAKIKTKETKRTKGENRTPSESETKAKPQENDGNEDETKKQGKEKKKHEEEVINEGDKTTKENTEIIDKDEEAETTNASFFTLEEGREFEGYILKCPNGPFDYALKLWDDGRAAPRDDSYPREEEEVAGLVIDRNGDYLTVACGTNIAYATRKSFLTAGVDPDDLSLPFGRLQVTLTRATTRPEEVPAAAWVATPTQITVPPYDIY